MATPRTALVISPEGQPQGEFVRALAEAGFEVEASATLDPARLPDIALVNVCGEGAWPTAEQLAEGRVILIVDSVAALRRGFDLGAEDCVMADAHPGEVIARCEAVVRRTDMPIGGDPTADVAVYVDRRLWVNFNSRQVWVNGKPAQLTPREFRLLEHLILHRDATLSHDQILEAVWDRLVEGGRPTEVLKQYIWRLRQKIEADPNQPDMIVTDLGAGYRFISRAE